MDSHDTSSQKHLEVSSEHVAAVVQKLGEIGEGRVGNITINEPCKIPGITEDMVATFAYTCAVKRGVNRLRLSIAGPSGFKVEMWTERVRDPRGVFYNVFHRIVTVQEGKPRRSGAGAYTLGTLERVLARVQETYRHSEDGVVFGAATSQPSVVSFLLKQGYTWLHEKDRVLWELLQHELAEAGGQEPLQTPSFVRVSIQMPGEQYERDAAYVERNVAGSELVPGGAVYVEAGENFALLKRTARSAEKTHPVLPGFYLQKTVTSRIR
jgi:hypothetical protein